jgi:epoxyqueuosine reductase
VFPPNENEELRRRLISLAPEYGFALCGAVDLDRAHDALSEHCAFFDKWLAAGRHDQMDYLARGRDRRLNPQLIFPSARSVFCVAVPYEMRGRDGDGVAYASYMRGRDYHAVMESRLGNLMECASKEHKFQFKIFCDIGAVLERSMAHLAGLGWIGKNTGLIHPKLGGAVFLAGAFLDVALGTAPTLMKDHCGTCRKCLDACPTKAFPAPRELDARRCIANWTLERRKPFEVVPPDILSVGNRAAGCDVCLEVCPYTVKAKNRILPEFQDPSFDATKLRDWNALLEESENDYRKRVEHSALSRVKHAHFQRNVAYALASCADRFDEKEIGLFMRGVAAKRAGEKKPDLAAAWELAERRLRESAENRKKAGVGEL